MTYENFLSAIHGQLQKQTVTLQEKEDVCIICKYPLPEKNITPMHKMCNRCYKSYNPEEE